MKSLKFALPALLALTIPALAAPCATDDVRAKDPKPQHVDQKSSDVDRSSKNLAGGSQPASPGTIGAMNNVGANQRLGEKPGTEARIDQGGGVGTSSKNLAGGAQPASPGTVGAMNNAGVEQKLGNSAGKGGDC